MKKILIISTLLFILNLIVVGTTLADTGDTIIKGLSNTGNQAGFAIDDPRSGNPGVDFPQAFANFATGLAGILSGLFLILMIYGGWLWMSARGNEDQVGKAKKIILGAVIGLAIIIAGRIIAELALLALGKAFATTAGSS